MRYLDRKPWPEACETVQRWNDTAYLIGFAILFASTAILGILAMVQS